ncbi:MAG TPA: alpha/beta hydrolase [Tepidiformaceae bacterium]|nr:alpha/beta hydrolase [Tepidiformaceae bacterium]
MRWPNIFAWAIAVLAGLALLACSPREPGPSSSSPTAASAASPSPTASPTASPPTTPALDWQPCEPGFECAMLEVPLDYSGHESGTMDVPLVRHRATEPSQRLGVLLANPGGPGASGVDFVVRSVAGWPEGLRQRFDIIGFDPRGVSGDTAVDCTDNLDAFYDADPSPDTPQEHDTLVAAYQRFARECEARSGKYLPYIGGDVVVQDIDRIREALGEDKLSFLGLSYGTYLGAKYADRYPQHVRAFVLDGPTDPSLPGKDWQLQQALGFETALHAFLADCASSSSCPFRSDGDPESAYDALMADIEAAPVAVGSRTLGPGEASTAVAAALYSKNAGWPRLAQALADAQAGDGGGLLGLFDGYVDRAPDGTYDDFGEVYRAISCVDLDLPRDVAGFDAMAAELSAASPRFGATLAYEHLDCAFWPVHAPTPQKVTATGAPPILVVGTTRDPATPLVWARSLASQLESGVLLELDGDGHVAFRKSRCIDSAIERYLVDLELPSTGTVCS